MNCLGFVVLCWNEIVNIDPPWKVEVTDEIWSSDNIIHSFVNKRLQS